MILKVLKIAGAFRRVQFENFQNHEYLLFTNCTRRSCDFFIYSTLNKITSFPWKLNRYSYGVQFGINCATLDQSKLGNFVECTIKGITLIIIKATFTARQEIFSFLNLHFGYCIVFDHL